MHSIGILAHSADGAALCFLEMVRESARRLGAHQHPEITLSILPMAPTLEAYERERPRRREGSPGRTAHRLADAGCDFFVCPDNTAHIALERPGAPLPLPGLHIAEIVARRARSEGHRVSGCSARGGRWKARSIPRRSRGTGLEMRTPAAPDRALVDDVIFASCAQGADRDPSRAEYVRIIEDLKRAGCDAVALSCTEIPLLVTPDVSPLPTLDSTRLLARAAVAASLGDTPLPTWRGGPF